MFFKLGWEVNDADAGYAECNRCRQLNAQYMREKTFPLIEAHEAADKLKSPWILKDPRYVFTLNYWEQVFSPKLPLVIWLVRDMERVRQSYKKRNYYVWKVLDSGERVRTEGLYLGNSIEDLFELARNQFSQWGGPKIRLDYEDVKEAVSLFDVDK
jgi:hypothetical protein